MVGRQASDLAHTVVLDWDGTLVPAAWPDRPNQFLPGAVEALTAMNRAGLHLTVHTARMNPYDPFTGKLIAPGRVAMEKLYVRGTLDKMGLTFVDIWDKPGKPSGSAYVDDKGYRYPGTSGAWKAVANTLIMHLAKEPPVFPAMPRSDDLEHPVPVGMYGGRDK
jgi:hypothetical protein